MFIKFESRIKHNSQVLYFSTCSIILPLRCQYPNNINNTTTGTNNNNASNKITPSK